ncbi:MAG: right-handed parallel beta-helix repeat-containing protein [Phycisphaerales bacterium]|nr:right-handed parallel beta-helix repeat-containing protein [Phycisphaerales bacterium]
MSRTNLFACLSLTAGMIAAAAIFSHAGPLDPPAGPVAPSYKTLTEVEPRTAINAANTPGDADSLYRISKSGSYYLTGNITGVAGKCGIEIAASGVTLDLCGFEMLGTVGMGAFDGITVTPSDGVSIVIRNGSIRRWGDCGIEFIYNSGHPPTSSAIENLSIGANVRYGVYLEWYSSATNCRFFDNGSDGILTSAACTITSCIATGNAGDGISVNTGCVVNDCTARTNTGTGFNLGLGCTLINSTAANNLDGASGQGCTIQNCSFEANSADGFSGFEGNTIIGCTAYRNAGNGIGTGTGSTITDCTARSNDLDGIRVSVRCNVRNNTCTGNGFNGDGANIHVTSSDNRIEGNLCSTADRGIDVDSAGNFIVRNTCAANTLNWDIVANNVVGPIIDRTTPGSAAISGDAAPDSTGSTHHNANFTY